MIKNTKYLFIHKIITEPCARNPGAMACIPLRECPQVRDLSMKILKHGKGSTRQDLFGQIQDRLCGEKVTKDLLVCCDSEKKYANPGLHHIVHVLRELCLLSSNLFLQFAFRLALLHHHGP